MNIGQILQKAGGAFAAPTKTVTFKVVGRDADGRQIISDASAALVFVDEREREAALIESEKFLRTKFPDGVMLSADRLLDSNTYHLLQKALRDSDDARKPFAFTVDDLKSCLQRNHAVKVYADYLRFVDEEFPEEVDSDTFEELAEAAGKKSLSDLLSQFGSSVIRRALPSLAARLSKSQTPTSTDGEPG